MGGSDLDKNAGSVLSDNQQAMLGRAYTQAAFDIVVEIANRDAGHVALRLQHEREAVIALQSRQSCSADWTSFYQSPGLSHWK